MANTKIEWTEKVWNPVRGCAPVSAGCEHCYAARQAHRFSGVCNPYEGLTELTKHGPKWNGIVRSVPELLTQPMRWKKPRRIFVNSMSDLFHPDVDFEFIAAVFGVMAASYHHTFQILTKRPKRMREWFDWAKEDLKGRHAVPSMIHHAACVVDKFSEKEGDRLNRAINKMSWWRISRGLVLPNVWIGVSVENQATADKRIQDLLETPAEVRWVSMEPLLDSVLIPDEYLTGEYAPRDHGGAMAEELGPKLDWIVCGGESGPGARPMDPAWVRSIRDQCQAAKVPFLFKQWGGWKPHVGTEEVAENVAIDMPLPSRQNNGKNTFVKAGGRRYEFYGGGSDWMRKVSKKMGGRELDGRIWDEYPVVER
jgi:protein gp37